MTDLATLIAHAWLTDLERAVLLAILPAGEIHGSASDLAQALGLNRSSLFRTLARLERAELIMRTARKGRSGSMLVTFNGRTLTNLRALCDHLGRESERPGAEYTPVRKEDEQTVREDRARFVEQKRARVAALGLTRNREENTCK